MPLELNQRAQELLTVNTHLSLFRIQRLPYGAACAKALLQAVMDQILHGMPGAACCLDDVVIPREGYKQCHDRVKQVLMHLGNHDIRVNAEKCKLFSREYAIRRTKFTKMICAWLQRR